MKYIEISVGLFGIIIGVIFIVGAFHDNSYVWFFAAILLISLSIIQLAYHWRKNRRPNNE